MTGASVNVDTKAFEREIEEAKRRLSKIGREAIPAAAMQAINRTGQRVHTRTRRELAKAKGLPQKVIGERISFYKATLKTLAGRVWIGLKRGIPLEKVGGARFDLRTGTLRAGKVSVKPFRATVRGKTLLWVRKLPTREPRERNSKGDYPALPIERPTLRLQPEAQGILNRVAADQARTFLPAEFRRLLNLRLQKYAQRRR